MQLTECLCSFPFSFNVIRMGLFDVDFFENEFCEK